MFNFTRSKGYLVIEFILLCLVLPAIIIIWRLAPFMFYFLWGAALYCLLIFYKDYIRPHQVSWRTVWGWEAVTWANFKPILLRFLVGAVALHAITAWYDPDRLFGIFERSPQIIPFLLVGYPVLSALPQEFIFCTFFFARYLPLLPGKWSMIMLSSLVFAWAHVLFINPIAPTVSFVGGLIFALTYWRHRSLALVTIEHGLYGNWLFLVGLGWYFFGGAVH